MVKLSILIGGKAGQGANKVSSIISNVLAKYGYYTFDYRDYQSLIRGGHNFNVLSISDKEINSQESKVDILVAFDSRTKITHEKELKKKGLFINSDEYRREGRNLNIAVAGALIKILGIHLDYLNEELEKEFSKKKEILKTILESAKKGYDSKKEKFKLKKLDNKIEIISGSKALALGARKSDLDVYIAYPMTPSTNVLHEIAKNQVEENRLVFQAENEIAVANMALGASFSGAKIMVGTSGGGFDLMSEALSMQGVSEIPLTVYLASRTGPGTAVPTYTSQADLNIALNSGHGEFYRTVIAPANPKELIKKTPEALFLAEKFKSLSIILSDKHLAESEYSFSPLNEDLTKFKIERDIPGQNKIVKASSYESDEFGNSTERADITELNSNRRFAKAEEAEKFISKNFEMIKIHGKKSSKNLIITWGSTTNAVLDASKSLDVKILQIIYMNPMSRKVAEEIKKAEHTLLIECNVTGQLGSLIKQKTGLEIPSRILKYDGRPFYTDELKKHIEEWLKA